MSKVVTIALIDDHPSVLQGVAHALRQQVGTIVATITAPSVTAFLERPDSVSQSDVALLDVQLNDDSRPADNVAALIQRGLPVLLYTQEPNPVTIARCLQAGALGLVGKHEPLEVLSVAIEHLLRGEPHLSQSWAAALEDGAIAPDLAPREQEALSLYATGIPLKSVARRMGISPDTAKEYLLRTRRKYADVGRAAATRTDLYVRAVEDGHLPLPGRTVRPH